MKKIPFFAIAALTLGLAACSSDEVVDAPATDRAPIAFSTFIDHSTQSRAAASNDLTNASLKEFAVYGFHYLSTTTSGTPSYDFSGDKVTGQYGSGNSTSWSYTNTQYWQTGNTYWFSALAPYGGNYTVEFNTAAPTSEGQGIIKITNFDNSAAGGTQDLIYAKPNVLGHAVTGSGESLDISNLSSVLDPSEKVGRVPFTFSHLLSRIRVELANGDNNTSVLCIKDLKITDAITSNSIDLTQANPTWTSTPAPSTGDLAYPATYYVPGITDGAGTVAYETWQSKAVSEAWETGDGTPDNTLEVVRYIIPGQHSINLSFTASFYYKSTDNAATNGKYKNTDGTIITKAFTAAAAVSETESELYAMGTAYVIKATINPENVDPALEVPIQFTVAPDGVTGWVDESTINVTPTTN